MRMQSTSWPLSSAKRGPSKMSKRASAALVVALAGILAVGGAVAFIVDRTVEVTNSFGSSKVACVVYEDEFNQNESTVKENVGVTNTGDVDAYIRAKVVVNWVDSEGNVLGIPPAEGEGGDYIMSLASESDWSYCKSDGFYYYAGRVPAGESTEELIESCTVIGSAPDTCYTLSVEILASAIQADGLNDEGQPPVVAEWGVTLDADSKTISKA